MNEASSSPARPNPWDSWVVFAALLVVLLAAVYRPALNRSFTGDPVIYFAELDGNISISAGLFRAGVLWCALVGFLCRGFSRRRLAEGGSFALLLAVLGVACAGMNAHGRSYAAGVTYDPFF